VVDAVAHHHANRRLVGRAALEKPDLGSHWSARAAGTLLGRSELDVQQALNRRDHVADEWAPATP
jgi:hypothetical protein